MSQHFRFDTDLGQWACAGCGGPLEFDTGEMPHALSCPETGRPVYVLAVGHDLAEQDAENIQRAVFDALRADGVLK